MWKNIMEKFSKKKQNIIDVSTNSLNIDEKFKIEIKKIHIKNIQVTNNGK